MKGIIKELCKHAIYQMAGKMIIRVLLPALNLFLCGLE